MNRVVHFEIHAADPERAARFYRDVFGWVMDPEGNRIELWEPPIPAAGK